MATKDLLRRVAILKRNPQYAQLLPQQDFVALAADLVEAFKTLQKAVSDGRLKGDKGEPGYSPVREFESAVGGYERRFAGLMRQVEDKLAAIRNGKDGRDGKDAEITPELVRQVAEMASEMVELPDFPTLITQEPGAIRNALELLQGDDRLSVASIRGLPERFDELVRYVGAASGGTIGKQQVYAFIRQAVSDGTIPAGGSVTVETPTGTVNSVNAAFTVTAIPKWIVSDGTTYYENAGYTRSSLNITMDIPPSSYIRSIS